jgi:hypothetical protein
VFICYVRPQAQQRYWKTRFSFNGNGMSLGALSVLPPRRRFQIGHPSGVMLQAKV